MKISVIIPSFKPQKYIWECLDSLKAQTFPKKEFEVILVLNGCCEPWKSQIESFITEEMNGMIIKLIQTETPGVSNARNIGIESATGEYISFIDDDDFVSPTYLEELYNCSSKNVLSLCYPLSFIDGTQDYKPFYITKEYIKGDKEKQYSYKKAKRYFSGPVYKLIHKDIIGHKRFNTAFKNGEDSIFMFEISNMFSYVTFTSEQAIYFRRIRKDSALSRRKTKIEILSNVIKLCSAYSRIYFCHPFQYNWGFYITRVIGAMHGGIKQIEHSSMNKY